MSVALPALISKFATNTFANSNANDALGNNPIYEGGRLVGIADAEWAPMLNSKGKPLGVKRNADAEGLRLTTIDGLTTTEEVPFANTFALRRATGARWLTIAVLPLGATPS